MDYGLVKTEIAEATRIGYGLHSILGHGEVGGLRKELELEVAFEEMEFNEPIFELPDLGLESSTLSGRDR